MKDRKYDKRHVWSKNHNNGEGRADSCSISTDKAEIQPAIYGSRWVQFDGLGPVASLEATEEIVAVASFPPSPIGFNHHEDTYPS